MLHLFTGLIILLMAFPASAQWKEWLQDLGLGQKTALTEAEIGSGLKEALRVGTASAVRLTGRTNGYLGNKAIKILMPKRLETLEKGLRVIGYGAQVDRFVLNMNRSAEGATPLAKDIFLGAIGKMTLDDARKIFSGGDTAATDYFKDRTLGELTMAFRPVVAKSMNRTGVVRQYKELVRRYEKIPFVDKVLFDVDAYVVGKALDGLFFILGQEERKIRTDPSARVTGLLREVFGS